MKRILFFSTLLLFIGIFQGCKKDTAIIEGNIEIDDNILTIKKYFFENGYDTVLKKIKVNDLLLQETVDWSNSIIQGESSEYYVYSPLILESEDGSDEIVETNFRKYLISRIDPKTISFSQGTFIVEESSSFDDKFSGDLIIEQAANRYSTIQFKEGKKVSQKKQNNLKSMSLTASDLGEDCRVKFICDWSAVCNGIIYLRRVTSENGCSPPMVYDSNCSMMTWSLNSMDTEMICVPIGGDWDIPTVPFPGN